MLRQAESPFWSMSPSYPIDRLFVLLEVSPVALMSAANVELTLKGGYAGFKRGT